MKNILKDIQTNCEECGTAESVLAFLKKRGDISYTSEWHREIWFFYLETMATLPKSIHQRKDARNTTIEVMRISEGTFNEIRKKYRRLT